KTTTINTTESSNTMERIDLIYLRLAIDAITNLTQDNFSLWHTQILHYLDCLSLKEFLVDTPTSSHTQTRMTHHSSGIPSMNSLPLSMLQTVQECGMTFLIWPSTTLKFSALSLRPKRCGKKNRLSR
ncbi:hypothetical protein VP01_12453g1, partial [Puccinia sorghi]